MTAPRSMQGRLLALLMASMAAVWLAAAVGTWIDVRHELDELLDGHLAQAAALLVVQQVGEIAHDDGRTVEAPAPHGLARRTAFQVFHEGQLVLRSADAPRAPLLALASVAPLSEAPGAPGAAASATARERRHGEDAFHTVTVEGDAWRVFATRGGGRGVQVLVGERIEARDEIVRATMWGTLAPLLLALPVLAVLAWLAIRRGLRPLLDLGRQLAGRPASSPASVQPVVLHDAPSEMQPVLRALNELLARIESMWQAERRFTADAAHELRTPIAAIRAQAQVALAAAGAGDTAVRQHALAATLEGCDRATRLVEQLLTLSRLEAGARVAMQPVDLAAVAHQVLADLAPRALGRSQELGLDVAPDERGTHLIEGDATLLAVLLRNLVDNALRYSPGGARVSVAVQRTNGHPCLTVEDSGPGIAAAERERLGQRFHRGEGHAASGSGLGWSIVERIAESHGLQIAVDSSPTLGGLRVRLTAPGRAGP